MNSLTLTFKSQELEEKFQENQQRTMLESFRVYWKISFIVTFVFFLNGVLRQFGFIELTLRACILFLHRIEILFDNQEIHQPFKGLGLSLKLTIDQFYEISGYSDPYEILLSGASEFIIYLTALGVPNYKLDSLLLLLIFLMKIVASIMKSSFQPYQGFFAFTFLLLTYQLFFRERQLRENFLLTIKEDNFGKLMITLICFLDLYLERTAEWPYLIFNFDEDKKRFMGKKSGNLDQIQQFTLKMNEDDILKEIIRNFYIGKKTVENYLAELIKNSKEISQTFRMDLRNNEKEFSVTVSIYQLKEIIVILAFDDQKRKQLQNLKLSIQPMYQQFSILQNQFDKQLKNYSNFIRYIQNEVQIHGLTRTQRSIYEVKLKNEYKTILKRKLVQMNLAFSQRTKHFQLKITQFNLKSCLQQLQRYFHYFHIRYHNILHKVQGDQLIKTDKILFLNLMLNIIFQFKSDFYLKISLITNQQQLGYYEFLFQGKLRYNQKEEFCQLVNNLAQFLGPDGKNNLSNCNDIFMIKIYQNLKQFHLSIREEEIQ